ncbi:MAG: tetratricopeptide repeat protein, partial [Cyclobacteriaceae bacterium]|nr:tetratricopeptide repeat protein [Cyclobacteriaceae bacterium]
EWISGNKLLGKKSMEYVVNQYNFINFQLDNGLDPDNLGNDEQYDKLLTLVKKDHSEAHYLAFDIYESLLKQYLVNRKSARYRTLRVEYERAIEKNFKKQSLHYKNLDALEFNAKLSKDKTRNLEDKAKTILADFQSLPEYHSKRVMILGFMYRVSIKNRDFQHAETYLKNIIDIEKHLYGEESPKYHLSMVRLANFYMDYTSKIADAKDIYDHSFEKIVKRQITTSHNDYLTIITHLASLYEYQDELGKSAQTLDLASKAALEKYRNPEDIEYGKVLEKIGDLQIKMGDYISAEKNINQALDIYDKAKVKRDEYNVINLVKAYETKARLLGIKGEFDDAEELINSAEDLLEGALTLEGYDDLKAKDELVSLQIYLGKFSDSNENLNQILKEYRKLYGENSGKLVNPLINKGRLSLLLGEYTEAEKIAREANRIAVNIFGENSSKTAETLSLLGELYTLLGDYERAIQSINSAISIKKRKFGEEHITVAIDLAKLGTAKYYKGDPDTETEPILLSAKKIISEKLNEQNPRFADINKSLALIYIRSGRFSDAFGALTVAENIWLSKTGRGGRRNVNVGGIYILTGDAYYHQKNYIKAEESYEKARIIYRRALRENHPEYIKILSKLSKANYMQGEYEESKSKIEEAMANYKVFIKDYFPALSEREKAKFWNTIRPDFEFYNTLILRNINDDKDAVGKIYNNALMTKALLLNSSIKIRERIMSSSDEELKERYSEWVDKKEFLTKVLAMSEEQLVENSINPLRLTQEVETLERQLSQSSSLFSQNIEESAVTWNQVRGSLKNNEAALEMVRFRYFDHVFTDSIIYAGLYVKNSAEFKQPGIVMLNNGYDLENRNFIFYRRSLEFGVGDNRSYGMYWEPIAKEIGEQYSVYFSPDGVFNLINLESLPTGEGKYVIDNSNIILVSNTKDIYLNRNKPKAVRSEESMALMFGNPDFYLEASSKHTLPDLPGTEKEVRQLRRLMVDNGISSDYFTSFEATEEQIKSLKSPEILHIATHGFFQEEKKQQEDDMEYNEAEAANNPLLRTGLVLTGGGDIIEK